MPLSLALLTTVTLLSLGITLRIFTKSLIMRWRSYIYIGLYGVALPYITLNNALFSTNINSNLDPWLIMMFAGVVSILGLYLLFVFKYKMNDREAFIKATFAFDFDPLLAVPIYILVFSNQPSVFLWLFIFMPPLIIILFSLGQFLIKPLPFGYYKAFLQMYAPSLICLILGYLVSPLIPIEDKILFFHINKIFIHISVLLIPIFVGLLQPKLQIHNLQKFFDPSVLFIMIWKALIVPIYIIIIFSILHQLNPFAWVVLLALILPPSYTMVHIREFIVMRIPYFAKIINFLYILTFISVGIWYVIGYVFWDFN